MIPPKWALGAVVIGMLAVSACGTSTGSESGRTDLVLTPEGVGPYLVGQPADEIIEGLSASIGGPDGDSTEPDSPLLIPDCGEPGTRVVAWGSLVLFFVDRIGSSVLATWSYGFDPITGSAGDTRSLGLVTEEGIGIGASRQELDDAYGLRVRYDDDVELDLSTFTIDGSRPEHLGGRMTSTDSDGEVQFLERRPACTAP